jgi:tRNA uridine 5-carboxymethylaminomethyl modification enzyme
MSTFDVVVVGAGHAGCEAAAVCARLGLHTALVTADPGGTARMSCNPAIGGIAKGHMVRELDALGGLMGRVTDRAGIQFRMLNRGRGPAVWSPRAQCDKARYSLQMRCLLETIAGLELVGGEVEEVRFDGGRVASVGLADGRNFRCRAVVIGPGTFLNGLIHIGPRKLEGGRAGEHAARLLSRSLARSGLELGRLKTGTPPRLHRGSIDWQALAPQWGDEPPVPFSHWTESLVLEQRPCWITRTGEPAHRVIRGNIHRSPLFSGEIRGRGPRYCPSIEDKVMRFPERRSHQLFLEPEGLDVPEIYVNGLSSSLPEEVQLQLVRSVRGLERAEMLRPGYAVEYDFVRPHQLGPTLEVRGRPGLFLAGQICGTSGYEEAAAQGFVAGVNAAHQVLGRDPFVLRRDEAYVGVLVDDLVTREHLEPYRMFTSAAEHRLLLRADNADQRLAETGHRLGLLTREQVERVRAKYAAIEDEERRLARIAVSVPAGANSGEMATVSGTGAVAFDTDGPESCRVVRALDHLTRPGVSYQALADLGVATVLPVGWGECLEVRVRYRGYIDRQQRFAARTAALDRLALPAALWGQAMTGLSREAREKLLHWRPSTIGQASRIAGVTPSDIAVLLVYARRQVALQT